METLHCTTISSPVGPLFLAASAKGLVALEFDARLPGQQSIRPNPRHIREENLHNQNARTKSANNKDAVTFEHSPTQMRPYITELEEYFRGHLRNFTLPLDLRGTQFQQSCWQALQAIPYGETRSYAQIARAIGHPQAFRAVGAANHSNPIAIVVPCHRVIAASGQLCGYGGGLHIKRQLLELEGARALQLPQPA